MRVVFPSEKKFEVFHAVETMKLSRREAARRFRISPTRVQQIVADVAYAIAQYGSKPLLKIDPARLELVSLRNCYEQLTFFRTMILQQCMAGEGQGNTPTSMARMLSTAARLSIEQSKVAARIGATQQAMLEAGTLREEEIEFVFPEDDNELGSELEVEESVAPPTPAESEPPAPATAPAPVAIAPPVSGCTAKEPELTPDEIETLLGILENHGPDSSCEQLMAELTRAGLVERIEQTPAQFDFLRTAMSPSAPPPAAKKSA